MTAYGVKIVGDDVLPDEIEWMFVKMRDGGLELWLTCSSAGSARVLSEAWAAYRCIEDETPPRVPRPREPRMLRVS